MNLSKNFEYSQGTVEIDHKFIPVVYVDQNLESLSLLREAFIYGDPKLVFLVTMFNGFQSFFECTPDNDLHYGANTQAINYKFLKLLDAADIIEILSVDTSDKAYFDDFKRQLLNGENERYKMSRMYSITFNKKRSISLQDKDLLRRILHILKIDEHDIQYKEIKGNLILRIHPRVLIRNIVHGNLLNRCIKCKDYLLEKKDSFKEDKTI